MELRGCGVRGSFTVDYMLTTMAGARALGSYLGAYLHCSRGVTCIYIYFCKRTLFVYCYICI
mgnify:FL=1